MGKNTNNLLLLGISILVMGLFLLSYSISSYTELKSLDEKMNFEELEDNNQMSSSDKYYRYLSNSDYLNQKLNKNKDLLIKNASCVYLDYAEHNAVGLYELTYNGLEGDTSRKNVAAGNVRSLYNILNSYRTCSKTSGYKDELKHILDEIEHADTMYDRDMRMDNFMGENIIRSDSQQTQQGAAIAGDSYSSNQNDSQNVYPQQPIQPQPTSPQQVETQQQYPAQNLPQ